MFLVNRRGFGLPSSFPSLLVFPGVRTCVGVTGEGEVSSSCLFGWSIPVVLGAVSSQWGVHAGLHLRKERVLLSYYSFRHILFYGGIKWPSEKSEIRGDY